MLNLDIFIGEDGGIQHADRFAGVHDHLERGTDRWYAAAISTLLVCELISVARM